MAGFWTRLYRSIRKSTPSETSRRESAKRRLRVEMLEGRRLLAADYGAVAGTIFTDLTDNGLTADDVRLSGATVQLFRDGGDNTFNNGGGDDTLIATATTDASGNFRFSRLAEGRYFVVQSPVTGLLQRAAESVKTIDISAVQAAGVIVQNLDTFNTTTQSVTAVVGITPTASSSLAAPEAVGGERDLLATATGGTPGQTIQLVANLAGVSGVLAFESNSGTTGTRVVTYDGPDGDATTLNPTGLGGIDLTGAGSAVAFRYTVGTDLAGTDLTIRVFSSAGNFSVITVPIPVTAGGVATEVLDVRFDDPAWTATGTGANFANVGAIQFEFDTVAAGNGQLDNFGTIGEALITSNAANLNPMTIGNLVWIDTNNNGVRDSGEFGAAGVTLELYQDSNSNGTLEVGTDTLIGTTSTNATGNYSFTNLLPGNYFVLVPITQFGAGQPLEGHATSTGNDPTPNPNNNVDNDDNGSFIAGVGVATALITLTAGGEPIDDGDTDPNTNLTIDLGFAPLIDLAIDKTANLITAIAGAPLTYTLSVTNNGPETASNVVVSDPLPNGVTFVSVATSQGTASEAGGTITANLGTLASNANATITVVISVPPNATGPLVNNASVTGDGQERDLTNNQDQLTTEVDRQTDLRIVKTDTPDPVIAGDQLTYTLTVTNDGPSLATNVTVSDTLPGDVNFVSVDSSQGAANQAGGVISGNLGDLAPGASATVTVIVGVPAGSTVTTVQNTATVTGAETDPNPNNNSSTATTDVNRNVDVRITKADSPDPVSVGGTLTYTLSVTNDGPSVATNVVVSDTLPAGLTFNSVDSTIGTGSFAGGVVTVNVGTLQVAQAATITLIVGVNANAPATITNTATVTVAENDTNPGNNTATTTTATQQLIDLVITKVDTVDPVIAGQDVIYTLTVTNNGPSNATGVTVVDALPNSLTFVSATPSQGSATNTGNNVNVALGNLANGASATVTIRATVNPDATGTISNTATVSGNETETNTANNTDSETTTINRQVDLRVTKADTVDPVIAGGQLTYTIIVTNDGPSTATNVVMTDPLPAGVVFVSASSSSGTVANNNGTVTANIGTLNPGASATVTINATVAGTARGTLTNTATVTRTETDSNPNNDSATETTQVTPQLDISITKTDSVDPVAPGATLTYTITVTNSGPSTATNVVVTDNLPSQLTFVSGTASSGTVTNNGNAVTANIGNLASGASATVTINTTVNAGTQAQITNTATVTATETETNPNNNSATVTTLATGTAAIRGRVYNDLNRNGAFDTGEPGIAGVTITLNGTDFLGATVSRTTQTAADGTYEFANLRPGTYTVVQTQPAGFVDGPETAGTNGSTITANDTFTVNLTGGNDSVGNNFAENVRDISKRRFLASNN